MMMACCNLSAQSMKVVVSGEGEVLGRLVKTNATTYSVCVQDDYDVPKAGTHVEVFSAEKGQGIVYRHPDRVGNINVRKGPGTKYPVVAQMTEEEVRHGSTGRLLDEDAFGKPVEKPRRKKRVRTEKNGFQMFWNKVVKTADDIYGQITDDNI